MRCDGQERQRTSCPGGKRQHTKETRYPSLSAWPAQRVAREGSPYRTPPRRQCHGAPASRHVDMNSKNVGITDYAHDRIGRHTGHGMRCASNRDASTFTPGDTPPCVGDTLAATS